MQTGTHLRALVCGSVPGIGIVNGMVSGATGAGDVDVNGTIAESTETFCGLANK